MDDAPRQAFRDGGLADARIADEQRIVLLAAAQHLDGPVDLLVPADQRIDLALTRLLVEIDAVIVESIALLFRLLAGFLLGLLVDPAGRPGFGQSRTLGDAVADIVDGVIPGHLLLLQEVGGVALTFGKDRHQHVRAGHLLTSRRLDVDHGTLNHPLEPGSRLGVLRAIRHQILQFGLHVGHQVPAQLVDIHIAGPHYRGSILVVDQRQEQVLQRGVFVVPLVGEREGPVERLL